jgi:hypothetical protein
MRGRIRAGFQGVVTNHAFNLSSARRAHSSSQDGAAAGEVLLPGLGGRWAKLGGKNIFQPPRMTGLMAPNYRRLGGGKLEFCPYFRCHSSRSTTGGASTNAAYGSRTGHLALCSMSGFRLMTQHAQIAERKYCRPHARPFRLRFARVVAVFPVCSPATL